eukprot:TRINITY_DN3250_c0_g1_i1.p1 TRINITY_DN3250_c0_g1~~TRINITY_DN3250_c0_g1_i1.p1  ORF type:complete len:175 (-),score=34.68 TRINITY_DN3250_c0_g1_i1:60-584(-)
MRLSAAVSFGFRITFPGTTSSLQTQTEDSDTQPGRLADGPSIVLQPLTIDVTRFLFPFPVSPSNLSHFWPRFTVQHTEQQVVPCVAVDKLAVHITARITSCVPFHQSYCQHHPTTHGFQLGLSAVSWFGDVVWLVVTATPQAGGTAQVGSQLKASSLPALQAVCSAVHGAVFAL